MEQPTPALSPSDAELRACCAAEVWLARMGAARPFRSSHEATTLSDELVHSFDDAALGQALGAHARIGERRLGSTTEDRWSRSEQAGALTAQQQVQQRIAEGNRRYEDRFGRVFLIRAAGRTAEEILGSLEQRLGNDPDTEADVVRRELAEIVRLRLLKLLEPARSGAVS